MTIKLEGIKTLFFDDDNPVIDKADIFIKEDKIAKIYRYTKEGVSDPSKAQDEKPDIEADKVIDGTNRLAIPALINSHTHAYMTMFRNIADDVPFTKWLFDTISPLEDEMTGQESYFGATLANLEMIRSGTATYVDMHMTPDESAKAAFDSGMRVCLTRGLVGDTRNDEGGIRRLNEALHDNEKWCDGDRLMTMLAPHAPYTCGPDYLEFIASYAKENGFGLHIHLAEGLNEIEGVRKKYNMTPIEYAEKAGVFDVRTIAAHCVHLSGNDLDILKDKNVNVAVNPVSNMKLANGFSDVPAMLGKGISLCIGTDGAASNNSLNLFREMAIEALIHKGLNRDAQTVSAADVLKMATLGGAKALGRENDLGKIEEGYKADITILDLKSPSLLPNNNLVSALVYSCTGNEVDTVIVNGKILMEVKEVKTIDEEKLIFEMDRIGSRYMRIVEEKSSKEKKEKEPN